MTRITDLTDLRPGDTVYLFGSPFMPWVHRENPFIMEERVFTGHHVFRSTVSPKVEQICGWMRKDTYIFRGELTIEDQAELILEGLLNE